MADKEIHILDLPVDAPERVIETLSVAEVESLNVQIEIIRNKLYNKEPLNLGEERLTMVWARLRRERAISVQAEKKKPKPKKSTAKPARRTVEKNLKEKTKGMDALDLLDSL